MGITRQDQGFVEAASVKTRYFSGAAHVFVDGANIHFALYQEQVSADGTVERIIVARCVMPEANWLALRDMTEFAMREQGHPVPRPAVAMSMSN